MGDPVIEALREVFPVVRGQAALAARHSAARVVAGSGHAVHLHRPALVAGAIRDFMGR